MGGLDGESCVQSESTSELWCEHFISPMCVDRTVRCAAPPLPANTEITFLNVTNPDDYSEMGTRIRYRCPGNKNYFDYPLPDDFVSYFHSVNLNEMEMSCNMDG